MSVTLAVALFEINFIILPSFSLCHVKAAVIINRRIDYEPRANIGVWGLSPDIGVWGQSAIFTIF